MSRDELSKDQNRRRATPPTIKVRLASAVEKAAYEAADHGAEFYWDVKIVRLIDATGHPEKASETEHPADNATVKLADMDDDADKSWGGDTFDRQRSLIIC